MSGVTLADAIVYFKGDDKQLQKDLGSAEKKTDSSVGNMAKAFATTLAGGIAVAGTAILGIGSKAFDVASQIDAATDQIGASLGLTEDQAKAFGDVVKQVYGDNWGDSIEDVGKAVETVAKQLRLTADDPALATLTGKAIALRDTFDVDVSDSIDAVDTLITNFGLNGDEAFDFITKGFQDGLDSSGDFLDSVKEYGGYFDDAGFDADAFFSILETGSQNGVLGTDKIADAIKEMGIILNSEAPAAKEAFDSIGLNFDKISGFVRAGDEAWADYFPDIIEGLNSIEDPIARSQAQVAIFGTMAEDLGTKFTQGLSTVSTSMADMQGSTDALNTKYTNLGSVAEGMWRKFQVGIAPAGEAILGFVNDNLPAIEGVISTVSTNIATFIGDIPSKIDEVRILWEEDFGGMRTAAENFMTLDQDFEIFWGKVNTAFDEGGGTNEESWAEFLANSTDVFTSWVRVTLETLGMFFVNWGNTQSAWRAATEGDWSGFWSSLGQNFENTLNVLLNYIEFVFNVDLRNYLVQGLHDAWKDLKDLWDDISEWWASTIGGLLGMDAPDIRTPTFNPNAGIINPINEGRIRAQQDMDYLRQNWGNIEYNPQMQGPSTTINVYPLDASYQRGLDHGEGILDAMRFRGYE